MTEKRIDVEKLKEAIRKIRVIKENPYFFKKIIDSIFKRIDSLAHQVELNALDQISSKDYGADGVGLTHDEINSLAESVENEMQGCSHVVLSSDECLRCKIAKLEAENTALKAEAKEKDAEVAAFCKECKAKCDECDIQAQHERDEKALRVLAEMHIANADCCKALEECDIDEPCVDCWIAYAKQKAEKMLSEEDRKRQAKEYWIANPKQEAEK